MNLEAGNSRLRARIASLEEAVRGYEQVVRQQASELEALAGEHHRRAQDVAALLAQVEELAGQLAAARDEAQAASVAKACFLANMSHELRTPMNGVIGMTALLLDSELKPLQREYAEVVRDSARHLLGLLNDILDFSKLEAGQFRLDPGPVRLRRLVEDALDVVAGDAGAKGVELAGIVEDAVPDVVKADASRLHQVLLNLLGNAVKFTEAGEVSVNVDACAVDGGLVEIHFAVADTGIGITAAELAALFSPFTQADASTTRRFGGTGLGLAITRNLAEAMDGRAWAESTPEVGSCFHVTVLAEVGRPGAEADDSPVPSGAGAHVLVVDGHDLSRRAVGAQLRHLGVSYLAVGSPEEAATALSAGSFDAIFVDEAIVELPAAASLTGNQRRRTSTTVVVMAPADRPKGARGVVADARLTKPVRESRLVHVLRAIGTVDPVTPPGPTATDAGMAARRPLRILVAEDNALNQKVMERMLGALGYCADMVSDGADVLAVVSRGEYDVVFMDVQMPVLDGLQATRELRRRGVKGRPWIVALTADALFENRHRCIEAGMDDFLAKPLHIEELAAALERCPGHGRPAAP